MGQLLSHADSLVGRDNYYSEREGGWLIKLVATMLACLYDVLPYLFEY